MRLDLTRFTYPQLDSETRADGERTYFTPNGPAPSVTTILSRLPHPELDEWRKRVGPEEAARISKEATIIGSHMHNLLEAYVLGQPECPSTDPLHAIARQIFHYVRLVGLRGINAVWGVEVPLYVGNLYAGRTDVVGVYQGCPAIIDYKTSKYNRTPRMLDNYKLQCSAYALAHEHMFGQRFDRAVLLIGIRPNPLYHKTARMQRVMIEQDEMTAYKRQFIRVVLDHHGGIADDQIGWFEQLYRLSYL